jgi:hypothetical protein
MSVSSVNNKTLQLAELVISNEKYSGSTGYIASSSTFNSSLDSTVLQVGGSISATTFTTTEAGTSTFDDITAVGIVTVEDTLVVGLAPAAVNLNSAPGTILGASVNELSLTTGSSVDCAITSAYGNFGQVSSGLYRGNGIGKLQVFLSYSTIPPGGTQVFSETIPDFVGTGSTSYVLTPNQYPSYFSIFPTYVSNNGTDTLINITFINTSSSATINAGTFNLSVIAMN